MHCRNFIGPNFNEKIDLDLFFDEDILENLPDVSSMAQLLAFCGKFKSVGDAKRNGWDMPIPTGWNTFVIGKGKNRLDIFIWNPTTKN